MASFCKCGSLYSPNTRAQTTWASTPKTSNVHGRRTYCRGRKLHHTLKISRIFEIRSVCSFACSAIDSRDAENGPSRRDMNRVLDNVDVNSTESTSNFKSDERESTATTSESNERRSSYMDEPIQRYSEGNFSQSGDESGWGQGLGNSNDDWEWRNGLDDTTNRGQFYVEENDSRSSGGAGVGQRNRENFEGDGRMPNKGMRQGGALGDVAGGQTSDVTLLKGTEVDGMLPLIPSGSQANFYTPSEVTGQIALWGASLGAFLVFSKVAVVGALALTVPFVGPWAVAGLRNWEMLSKSSTYMGIWHAEILRVDLLDIRDPSFSDRDGALRTGRGKDSRSLRLVVGDPWKGGARVEMLVPCKYSPETVKVGKLAELLVLTDDREFNAFKAVREAFLPESRCWLADYPFIDRDAFYRTSYKIDGERKQARRRDPSSSWRP